MCQLKLFCAVATVAASSAALAQVIYQGPGNYVSSGNQTYGPKSTQIQSTYGSQTYVRGTALPGCNSRAIRFRVTCAAGKQINPRPTLVSQILTLTGIDELPQLINVLLGEMSIVGRRNVGGWPRSLC